jgi:hypothetical protein
MDPLANRPGPGARHRPHLLHALCLAWIAGVLAVGLLRHRSVEALWTAWREGDVEEQLEALQALTQRAETDELAAEFPHALLAADDPRLVELAFTNLFTRRAATHPDPRQLGSILDRAVHFRALSWLRNQTTSPRRFTGEDLDPWFEEPGGGER